MCVYTIAVVLKYINNTKLEFLNIIQLLLETTNEIKYNVAIWMQGCHLLGITLQQVKC